MNQVETHTHDNIEEKLGLNVQEKRRNHIKRRVFLGVVIFLVVFTGVKIFAGKNSVKVNFSTQVAEKGNLTITVSATGNLEPINQVDVGSELSGIIESVAVDHNDRVVAGQILAALDTSKLEAQVLKSRASLASARASVTGALATLSEAEKEMVRLKKVKQLSHGRAVSQHDLNAAEAALNRALAAKAVADASVSQAEALLNADETDLSKALIRSPINGLVLTRSVEPGQTVAASFQAPVLFTLAEDLTQMELHVDVDEADVGQVKEGQAADFFVDAYPDRTFPAQIKQVRYGSETVDGVVTYETILNVDNSDLSLRPGMTAKADIIVRKVEDAVIIPNAALRFAPKFTQKDTAPKPSRDILSKFLPRPPGRGKKQNGNGNINQKEGVWTVKDGRLFPLQIKAGLTDGIMTEIIAGDVEPGMELVVGSESVK